MLVNAMKEIFSFTITSSVYFPISDNFSIRFHIVVLSVHFHSPNSIFRMSSEFDPKLKVKVRRLKANGRERERMHGLNRALDKLRQVIFLFKIEISIKIRVSVRTADNPASETEQNRDPSTGQVIIVHLQS